jgi:hypothetical protein
MKMSKADFELRHASIIEQWERYGSERDNCPEPTPPQGNPKSKKREDHGRQIGVVIGSQPMGQIPIVTDEVRDNEERPKAEDRHRKDSCTPKDRCRRWPFYRAYRILHNGLVQRMNRVDSPIIGIKG